MELADVPDLLELGVARMRRSHFEDGAECLNLKAGLQRRQIRIQIVYRQQDIPQLKTRKWMVIAVSRSINSEIVWPVPLSESVDDFVTLLCPLTDNVSSP